MFALLAFSVNKEYQSLKLVMLVNLLLPMESETTLAASIAQKDSTAMTHRQQLVPFANQEMSAHRKHLKRML